MSKPCAEHTITSPPSGSVLPENPGARHQEPAPPARTLRDLSPQHAACPHWSSEDEGPGPPKTPAGNIRQRREPTAFRQRPAAALAPVS